MSGSSGHRGDAVTDGGVGADPCRRVWRGPINSPKKKILAAARVNDVLQVDVDKSGTRPVLVVQRNGKAAGSLTFRGYLDVINCIVNNGVTYEATIVRIAGGVHEVRIDPV